MSNLLNSSNSSGNNSLTNGEEIGGFVSIIVVLGVVGCFIYNGFSFCIRSLKTSGIFETPKETVIYAPRPVYTDEIYNGKGDYKNTDNISTLYIPRQETKTEPKTSNEILNDMIKEGAQEFIKTAADSLSD